MNVSLTPHFEQFVQALVGTGKYHSASEVVRDALRLLQEREDNLAQKREVLKAMLKAGLESGEPTEFNIDDFLARAEKRHNSNKDRKA